jgi:PEP-CTERM motif
MDYGSSGCFGMQKLLLAAVAAVAVFAAPVARAATVFNLTFTGLAAVSGSPSQVDGTGTITTIGGSGSGLENATLSSAGFKITDIDITLNLAHFGLGNTLAADLTTFDGNPVTFGYLGVDPAGAGPIDPKIVLTAYWGTPGFTVLDSIQGQRNFFAGTFDISPAVAGVPEPSSWAMLILGFGGVGVMLRGLRRKQPAPGAVRA